MRSSTTMLYGAALGCVLFALSCMDGENQEQQRRKEKEVERARTDSVSEAQTLQKIVRDRGAVVEWDSLGFQYSYAYQKVFKENPMTLYKSWLLKDVWERDTCVVFLFLLGTWSSKSGYLELTCRTDCDGYLAILMPDPKKEASWFDEDFVFSGASHWILARMDYAPNYVFTKECGDCDDDGSSSRTVVKAIPVFKGELVDVVKVLDN